MWVYNIRVDVSWKIPTVYRSDDIKLQAVKVLARQKALVRVYRVYYMASMAMASALYRKQAFDGLFDLTAVWYYFFSLTYTILKHFVFV